MKVFPTDTGSFARVLLRFASSQVASNFLRILAGFLVVRVVDPETYGMFSGVGIFLGYVLLGHGGIINGLSRELPYEVGRGNEEYARDLASSALVLTSVVSFLAAAAFLSFALVHFSESDWQLSFIFFSYSIMAALHLFNKQFLPVLYRTNRDFDSLSRQNMLVASANVISVSLVWLWDVWGLALRGVCLALYEGYLLFKNKPYHLNWHTSWEHHRKLFKTGWPIFIVGYVNPVWNTAINNMIFVVGGAVNFGLYSLANIVQAAVAIIPNAFSQVIYPKMAVMYGQGMPISVILRANIKPVVFQFAILLLMGVVGALLLPHVIPILLPAYAHGVNAAQWMMFLAAAQAFTPLNNIYNVIGRQKWYFISLVIGSVVGSVFIAVNINYFGFSLEVFPQGLLLGKAIQQILSLSFLYFLFNERVG